MIDRTFLDTVFCLSIGLEGLLVSFSVRGEREVVTISF